MPITYPYAGCHWHTVDHHAKQKADPLNSSTRIENVRGIYSRRISDRLPATCTALLMSVHEKQPHGWTGPREWEMMFWVGEGLQRRLYLGGSKSIIDVGTHSSLAIVRSASKPAPMPF
jgi:hypothetical protein